MMINLSMANKIPVLIFFWFCASHAAPTNILNQGNVLHFSASLVSENGLFTLRFGNVSNTVTDHSTYHYLGIWYQGADSKPFWVANRERPITASGTLVVDQTGGLLITYSSGPPLELYSGQSSTKVAAILQNDGNLVVKELKSDGFAEQVLWQSFDYPTDSFLPGMKLGINIRTGQKWSLSSWLTYSLPNPGAFTLDWDPIEHRLIAKLRGVEFWNSGALQNSRFRNIKLDSGLAGYNFIEVSDEDEKYITFQLVPNQYTPISTVNITWLLLNYGGVMADQSTNMEVFSADDCYGRNTDSGCKSLAGSRCRIADVFLEKVMAIDVSTVYSHVSNGSLSLSDCKNICWKNCDCFGTKSYNVDGTGCVFFDEPLTETTNEKQEEVHIIFSFPSGMSLLSSAFTANVAIPDVCLCNFVYFRSSYIYLKIGAVCCYAGRKEGIRFVAIVAATAVVITLAVLLLFLLRWRRARLQNKP